MKILINAIPLTGLLTGIARYLRNLYTAMEAFHDVDLFYFNGKNVSHTMPPMADAGKWQAMTRAIWSLPDPAVFSLRAVHWLNYERRLRRTCRLQEFDIYHETAFVPAKAPTLFSVYSIYDLSLRLYRETHPRERVWFFEYFIKKRLQYAGHILTISEFIRQEIIAELNVPPERVTAIPLAADPLFAPCTAEEIDHIKSRYHLPESYLLFVGSLEPRKNIDILIEAMGKLKNEIPLVLVGWSAWGNKEWMDKIASKGLSSRVFVTGHLPDADLKGIYSGATALIYPSLYEGFGLPILEAMACGCPVICSNVASMPEVAGDAALFIDPSNSDDLTGAIETLLQDSELRNRMINKGYQQNAAFNWGKTAGKTIALYSRLREYPQRNRM